ncbi:MAG: hypothetical protein FJW95_00710 [Actinobacteria bacterium]|nr:hypothetical protein [Actinomycetota bacterium]
MALAPRTLAAYRSDWADFARWCATRRCRALPADPATIVAYIDDLATSRRVATVKRRLAAIRAAHLDAGHRAPTDPPHGDRGHGPRPLAPARRGRPHDPDHRRRAARHVEFAAADDRRAP